MNNNKTQNVLIVVSLIFVVLVVANIFWFSFIRKSAKDVLSAKEEILTETAQNYNLINLSKEITGLIEEEKKIDEILIDRKNSVVFIETIENLGKISNVDLQIQKADMSVEEGGGHGLLKLSLRVNGSWSENMIFLKLIETIPHHVTIESINMGASSSEKVVSWVFNYSITAITN